MAGNTLQAMLIRLGFDLTGLAAGGMEAKAQIAAIAAQAQAAQAIVNAGNMGAPGRAMAIANAATAWRQYAATTTSGASTIVAAQQKVAAAADSMAGSMGGLKAAFGLIGLVGFLEFAKGSVQAATTFQTEMLLIQTQARASTAEVINMSDAILGMSANVQTGPEELARGLYHIESVGRRGAEALNILTVAAQGARVSNADLESVTNALVAAVTSGIKGVEDMTSAMGTLNGIVGSGNMRMQELTTSFRSGILSTGKTFGLTIQDVGMALAAMTDQGIPATEAATRLRIAIAQLGAPTTVAAGQLSRIGLSSRALADDMRGPDGLLTAIQDLSDHLIKSGLDATQQAAILKAAFGGSRSSTGILIMINSLGLMQQKLQIIKETSAHFAETFEAQSETAAARFATLSAAVGVLMVHIGNGLMPILTTVAGMLTVVAQQTWLVVPVFTLLTLAVIRLATVALIRLIASFGLTTAAMLLGRLATVVLDNSLKALAVTGVATSASVRSIGGAILTVIGPLNLTLVALTVVAAAYNHFQQEVDRATAAFLAHVKAVIAGTRAMAEEKNRPGVSVLDQLKAEREFINQQLKNEINNRALLQSIDFGPIKPGTIMSAEPALRAARKAYDDAIKAIEAGMKNYAAAVKTASGIVIDTTTSLIDQVGSSLDAVKELAGGNVGAAVMDQFTKELLAHQNEPANALKQLVDIEKTALDPMAEIAQLKGLLASKALADGLASGKPVVRSAAETLRQFLEEHLFKLGVNTKTEGFKIEIRGMAAAQANLDRFKSSVRGFTRDLQAQVTSGATTIGDAAKKIVDMIGGNLSRLKQVGLEAGTELMVEIAKGMEAARQAPLTAMENLHKLMKNPMSRMAEEAFIYAALTGVELARGLVSTDPVARAAAEAAKKVYTDRMDELTNGAWSAGVNAGKNFSSGWEYMLKHPHANVHLVAYLSAAVSNQWGGAGPTAAMLAAGEEAYKKFLASLDSKTKSAGASMANTMNKAANAIAAAFGKIEAAAMKYFNKIHQANLQHIEDHRKAVQAIIDSAQAGLDATSKAIELQNLLRAVQEATDPASQLAALQALHKFQAQQQIDAAQTALDKQIAAEKAAEDKRFSNQVAAFQKQLNSLERWLDKHPKLWREAQHKIIALLHSFGITYESAGNALGVSFAKGLKKAILALLKALHILAGGKAPSLAGFAQGAYNLGEDQLAMVHKNEMIIPAGPAGAFRAWMSGASGAGGLAGMSGGGERSGGTIVFQVGDQVLAELSDRRLFVAKSIREPTDIAFGGSVR